MRCSRRQFLYWTAVAATANGLVSRVQAGGEEVKLPIPPLLESYHGQPIFMSLQQTQHAFVRGGHKTRVWSVNGCYPAPTVRVNRGENVKLVYVNKLNEKIAMSVSGLRVPGSLNGGASRLILPGASWSPVLPIRQPAATCWYHVSTPYQMGPHLYNGLLGMWIVNDEISRSLALPNNYGIDDIPLILQDKLFNQLGEPRYSPADNSKGYLGDTLLTNGVENPVMQVPRGWIRLRLLNASNARCYQLSLNNQQPLLVIASDQGFLAAPAAVQRCTLAPGERREVLIDMSQVEKVILTAGEPTPLIERVKGIFQFVGRLKSTNVLTLRSAALTFATPYTLPTHLVPMSSSEPPTVQTREFHLGGDQPGINRQRWQRDRIDIQSRQGTYENWVFYTDTPQSLHIEGVIFKILRINGALPMSADRGWKDTVWVEGKLELLLFFPEPSSATAPFLYYSQALELADRGSMGQLQVNAQGPR